MMLAMYAVLRSIPIDAIMRSSSLPERPTNGRPAQILLASGRFPDKHHPRLRIAVCECKPGCRRAQRAALEAFEHAAQLVQALRRLLLPRVPPWWRPPASGRAQDPVPLLTTSSLFRGTLLAECLAIPGGSICVGGRGQVRGHPIDGFLAEEGIDARLLKKGENR